MSVRNLEGLFRPHSVALIGASNRPGSVGQVVMRNLLQGGFDGPIMPVNPRHDAIAGVLAYPDIEALPVAPDLAVIATPPPTVPDLVAALAARGTRAAVVLTAGLGRADSEEMTLARRVLDAARPSRLRILGPNCLGILVPGVGLNASFAHTQALPGNLALVSQSGALCTALLDWATSKEIGFSHFVSLGDGLDFDFGDALDYLGGDPSVHAILLYIESISHARKFMSAARSAASNKPVLVIKAGRSTEGAKAAASHTGALAGDDAVYDAAFRRAGLLRVAETEEIFGAVETLARSRPLRGERLAILTNGGGPGVMGADALAAGGGHLAKLSAETVAALDAVLPPTWSKGNPVDIIGDGDAERYRAAQRILLDAPEVDSVLVLHVPTAIVDCSLVADAVIDQTASSDKQVLTCWLGLDGVDEARRRFGAAGLPSYRTPEEAVEAFLHTVEHARNQALLREVPPSEPDTGGKAKEAAYRIMASALDEERSLLTEFESKELLAAYDIPVVETRVAETSEEVEGVAAEIGGPVAVKVLSRDISHKSDVGGVALDLQSPEAARLAAEAMKARIAERRPDATLDGFTVQAMADTRETRELILGIATDPTFGPAILFGHGGTAVELIRDRAIGLPPLNSALARDLVSRTRVARLLEGYRRLPAIDHDALYHAITRTSQIAIDLPEVKSMDINPLLAGPRGVLALDARFEVEPEKAEAAPRKARLAPEKAESAPRKARLAPGRAEAAPQKARLAPEKAESAPRKARLAIRPYPRELEETITLEDGLRVLLRPVRPQDGPRHQEYLAAEAPEDIRFKSFDLVRHFPPSETARLTQIDYDRQLGIVAVAESDAASDPILGFLRAAFDPDGATVQFALSVRGDHRGRGLGPELLRKLLRVARGSEASEVVGIADASNREMIAMAEEHGFTAGPAEDAAVELRHRIVPSEPAERGGPRRPTRL